MIVRVLLVGIHVGDVQNFAFELRMIQGVFLPCRILQFEVRRLSPTLSSAARETETVHTSASSTKETVFFISLLLIK